MESLLFLWFAHCCISRDFSPEHNHVCKYGSPTPLATAGNDRYKKSMFDRFFNFLSDSKWLLFAFLVTSSGGLKPFFCHAPGTIDNVTQCHFVDVGFRWNAQKPLASGTGASGAFGQIWGNLQDFLLGWWHVIIHLEVMPKKYSMSHISIDRFQKRSFFSKTITSFTPKSLLGPLLDLLFEGGGRESIAGESAPVAVEPDGRWSVMQIFGLHKLVPAQRGRLVVTLPETANSPENGWFPFGARPI